MKKSVTAFALTSIFLWIAAADAAAQGPLPGKGADACTLVSKAEIEQIFGAKLGDGKKNPRMQNPGVLSSCDYQSAGGAEISVLIRRNTTKYVAGSEKAEFAKMGMKLRYVKGMGTTAFYTDMMGMGTGLNIFRGDYDYILVSAMGAGAAEKASAAVEKLARLVLDHWK